MSDPEKKACVLIVDDQPVARDTLSLTLKKDDYLVYTASTGDQAIGIASEKHPDIILLDMSMPDADGMELCRSLKANPQTEDIAVIFLSGVTDYETKTEGLNLGAVDYIQKPFNPMELRARVQAHLRLKERFDSLHVRYRELFEKFQQDTRSKRDQFDPNCIDQGCIQKESKVLSFNTDIIKVQGVVGQLLIGVAGHLSKKMRNDLALGIHEMILNAVEHGNLGITSEAKSEALENQFYSELIQERLENPELAQRQVTIEYSFDGSRVSYRISDEGDGFDWESFLEREEPDDLLASNGRGILITRYIFDTITYNDKGNSVLLEKDI